MRERFPADHSEGMAMRIDDDALTSALGLPVEEPAVLAERRLASLDDLDEREWDRLWGGGPRDGSTRTAAARPRREPRRTSANERSAC